MTQHNTAYIFPPIPVELVSTSHLAMTHYATLIALFFCLLCQVSAAPVPGRSVLSLTVTRA